MSIHAKIPSVARTHAQLLRAAAQARKERRGAARAVARHHGYELAAILDRIGCADAVADGERLVLACAAGEPTCAEISPVLAHLRVILRRTRVTAPGHARAAAHRARLAALHALSTRVEALESVLVVTQLTEMPSLATGVIAAQTATAPI